MFLNGNGRMIEQTTRYSIEACAQKSYLLMVCWKELQEIEKQNDDLNGQIEASFLLNQTLEEKIYRLGKEIKRLQEYEFMYNSLNK